MPFDSLQNGRYQTVRELGSGSMGEVYLVNDTVIGRQVAIKIMRADPASYPSAEAIQDAVRLFKREAQAIARLEHPNILPLFDFGEEKREAGVFTYMVMPNCQEGSLSDWLKNNRQGRQLPLSEVVYFVEQAAGALQYAHEHGVIHQDVKPSNFLLRTHTTGQLLPDLLLADFGIARTNAGATVSTTSAGPRGTPRYMPPEQWEGKPTPTSDQYALAVTAYYLLTLRYPFPGEQMLQLMYQHLQNTPEPPSKWNPALSRDVDAVILHALAKKPEGRFPSIADFARALRQTLPKDQPAPEQRSRSNAIDISGPTIEESYRTALPTNPTVEESYRTSLPTSPTVEESYRTSLPTGPTVGASYNRSLPGVPGVEAGNNPSAPAAQSYGYRAPAPATPVPPLHSTFAGVTTTPQVGPVSYPSTSPQAWSAPPFAQQQPWNAGPGTPVLTSQPWLTQEPIFPARPPKRSSRGKVALLITLLLLLILAGAGGAWYIFLFAPAQQPPVDSNANPYISSMPALRFSDPLSKPNMWQSLPNDKLTAGFCLFQQGAYHASANTAEVYTLCPAASQQPSTSDMTFEIHMQILHGDCGGILFRGDYTQGNFYYFDVCFDGHHYLAIYKNFSELKAIQLQSSVLPALQTNPQTTVTIGIVTQGSTLTFYLDGQQIDQTTDSTYTSGQIALLCYSVKNPTEVVFSHARLWTA